jgi:xanthine dehydrogenase YagR molybdenum-binding subunit
VGRVEDGRGSLGHAATLRFPSPLIGRVAAEAMGLPVDRVTVRLGDTRFPPTAGSGGSFGSATSGGAVLAACRKLKAGLALGITEAEGSVTPADLDSAYAHAGFGAHFVEAAVHQDTGEVRVRRMLGVFAAGRILNERNRRSHPRHACHPGQAAGYARNAGCLAARSGRI